MTDTYRGHGDYYVLIGVHRMKKIWNPCSVLLKIQYAINVDFDTLVTNLPETKVILFSKF